MNWEHVLSTEFVDAIPFNEFAIQIQNKLTKRGFNADNTLFANCTCRDEINYHDLDIFAKHWGENFFLAGLGGYPSSGATGFRACLDHVPDDGNLLLLYGPHIGINESGSLGRVSRAGLQHETSACGALIGLTRKIARDDDYQPVFNELDAEQHLLEKGMQDHFLEISAAENSIKKVTEVSFSLIDKKINEILDFLKPAKQLALIGGITINTSAASEDYFSLLSAEIVQYKTDGSNHREDIF
ncbi:MAG: hypothetical protein QGI68_04620 [Pseudomonadales bacterium]|nr:hypothetical protein [Pseudomonadales bacterium]MDP7594837.1 hypothetical protein [Pseudomonadales bacterium]HJN51789.1 hypothetical protein [Pseudomonadales bacterium]